MEMQARHRYMGLHTEKEQTVEQHAILNHASFPAGIGTVGVELEGFWEFDTVAWTTPGYRPPSSISYCDGCDLEDVSEMCEECRYLALGLKDDPSVYMHDEEGEPERDRGGLPYVAGEAASPIYRSWTDLAEYVKHKYPDWVNSTCGMHVHIGCETQALHRFSFSPTYWDLITTGLVHLGQTGEVYGRTQRWLHQRIRTGQSTPSSDTAFAAPNSVRHGMEGSNGRYHAVNYHSFEPKSTLEVRLLPMADHGYLEALKMIAQVLKATSQYWTNPIYWDSAERQVTLADSVTIESGVGLTTLEPQLEYVVHGSLDSSESDWFTSPNGLTSYR